MNRPLSVTLLAVACLMLLVQCSDPVTTSGKPNIVLILSDDIAYHWPGFNGGKEVSTPNLDKIAEEGVKFTQFYVYSVCSPTRAALLTGRYPFRNGMEERIHASDQAGMLTDERTLADALTEAGYFTAIFGKWHLGQWHKKHLPMQRGFQYQYGHYSAAIDSFRHERKPVYDWHRNEEALVEEGYSTFLIANEVKRVLEKNETDKPFFFYISFNAVHRPHQAPMNYVNKYVGKLRESGNYNKRPKGYATTLAMMEGMDVAIGNIMMALEEKGVLDNTIVIFLNDNGAPRLINNAPYRGGKRDTYEGGVRVPLLIRYPAELPVGTVSNEHLHVTDLYPTLIRLAGGSLNQTHKIDGIDSWNVITGKEPGKRTESVYSVPGLPPNRMNRGSELGFPAIRQGDFKLIKAEQGDELYNIMKDPYEKTNVAAMYPEIVQKLNKRLDQLGSERRLPEDHLAIPGFPVHIYGELENAGELPQEIIEQSNASAATYKGDYHGKHIK